MKVPVSCAAAKSHARAELRYKPFGETGWTEIEMRRQDGEFRAELPCDAVELAGTLEYYVRAKDASGEIVDNFGASREPIRITVQNEAVSDPPAYPGEAPPTRCEGEVICPPDFPGCEDETASVEAEPSSAVTAKSRAWLGIHVAQDFAFISANNACSIETQLADDLHCFEYDSTTGQRALPYPRNLPGTDVPGNPYPGANVDESFVLATTRVLLSYDHPLTDAVYAGARLGYAFGGGPPTRDLAEFLPFHAELRMSYWFSQSSLKPYVHVGGGLAQVDARAELAGVYDCTFVTAEQAGDPPMPIETDTAAFERCWRGDPSFDPELATNRGVVQLNLDVWKKVGQGFATAGAGFLYTLTERLGLQLNVNGMYMFPSSGVVLEPSLGVVYGL
jgi:hypothetical protein